MSRLNRFNELETHPWLKRSFAKIKRAELESARSFIAKHESLDRDAYASLVVRMFLGNPDKPKCWKEIEELLIASL